MPSFILPVVSAQVVQYLPNFFFAALLMLLGVEITLDWLILSARKVSRPEYALLLTTFLAILQGTATLSQRIHHLSIRVSMIAPWYQLGLRPGCRLVEPL